MAQNAIIKTPIEKLGYNFIKPQYLPEGKDEYYLRNLQNRSGINYRNLTAYEIEALVKNRNTSDDWNKILVSDAFNPELVKNCKFFGLVRIGKLEPYFLEFSDMKYAVGLYNSIIISSDLGDNVVIENVNYLSHYIIGNEVIIASTNELATTDHSKFGNGILKEGEEEGIRIWMEICNENGGRKVIPFTGMLPGDAYLWSKYRDDDKLLQRFKEMTEQEFKKERGFYGKVGDRTVIKNVAIMKDVWIGSDAYIKGANKLKNLTIHSSAEAPTQIGEGCELVNGIISKGCRIFYGVKAVRFVMASHSQLKYGARLINSYLGNNATISCCEVLNSLIFPAHEQHHNNSFLCAALVMGQSNIPAGATIGSNHNSRAADGEIIAGRGFWPGLCVSLKHNSKFASFTMLVKGDYLFELNIPFPFSLISNKNGVLEIMPAYWFMYNMYALSRNAWKYLDRDNRNEKFQLLEYDYLAPDSVNEMFEALKLLELFTGKAWFRSNDAYEITDDECILKGKQLLQEKNTIIDELEVIATGFENSKRKTIIVKAQRAYDAYTDMILHYGLLNLIEWMEKSKTDDIENIFEVMSELKRCSNWLNIGGQLMTVEQVDELKNKIKNNQINSWDELHEAYAKEGEKYAEQKMQHALASLLEIENARATNISHEKLNCWLEKAVEIASSVTERIAASRKKDYTNPFRKMVYDSKEEMNNVLGKLDENSFVLHQQKEFNEFKNRVETIKSKFAEGKVLTKANDGLNSKAVNL
jgi:NDP-sugar pyrophosphorylase family protein